MNLHQIASGVISAVNPMAQVQIQMSMGNAVSATGAMVPAYAAPVVAYAQVQPVSAKDLRQVERLNLQGTLKSVYINGPLSGTVRPSIQGGDLVTLADGSVWLVAHVDEGWNLTANWTKAIIVLQNDAATPPPIT